MSPTEKLMNRAPTTPIQDKLFCTMSHQRNNPHSKVHGANMGPTWVLSAPDGPHVGPMNLAIWQGFSWIFAILPHCYNCLWPVQNMLMLTRKLYQCPNKSTNSPPYGICLFLYCIAPTCICPHQGHGIRFLIVSQHKETLHMDLHFTSVFKLNVVFLAKYVPSNL